MNKAHLSICIFIASIFLGCKPKQIESENDSSLVGIWALRKSCSYGPSGVYYINSFTYWENGSFEQTADIYDSAACTNKLLTQKVIGTYYTSTQTDNSSYLSINLDSTLQSILITPVSSTLTASYNSSTFCGINTWAVGQTKDITGQTCNGAPMPAAGAREYSIYSYEKSFSPEIIMPPPHPMTIPAKYKGNVRFGASSSGHDGSTEAQRHTTFNGNFIYVRQ